MYGPLPAGRGAARSCLLKAFQTALPGSADRLRASCANRRLGAGGSGDGLYADSDGRVRDRSRTETSKEEAKC
jgi:hypothetical protein